MSLGVPPKPVDWLPENTLNPHGVEGLVGDVGLVGLVGGLVG